MGNDTNKDVSCVEVTPRPWEHVVPQAPNTGMGDDGGTARTPRASLGAREMTILATWTGGNATGDRHRSPPGDLGTVIAVPLAAGAGESNQ